MSKAVTIVVALLGLVTVGFSQLDTSALFGTQLKGMESGKVKLDELKQRKATIFVLASPECPICQKVTKTLEELYAEYRPKGVELYGVFPGHWATDKASRRFARKYQVSFPFLKDNNQEFTKLLKGTITPEVFVFDEQGALAYSGMVDNWFIALGHKRQVVTEHYLKDALDAVLKGELPETRSTEAIGCKIFAEE